jgi:hypothetical protein
MFRMDLDRSHALSERQTSIDFIGVAPKSAASFLVRFYGHGDGELAAFTRPMIAAVSVDRAACPSRSRLLVRSHRWRRRAQLWLSPAAS